MRINPVSMLIHPVMRVSYTHVLGSGSVVATFESREQEITGSNPTPTTDPERGALRIPLGLCNPFRSTQPNDWETVIEG